MNRFAIVCCLLPALQSSSTLAQDTTFTFQGRLSTGNGAVDSATDFQFTLWDAETGGNQIGSTLESPGTAVADGLFTVDLDFGALAFDGGARWLEVAVGPPGEALTTLAPRQPVTASPYALRALDGWSRTGNAGTDPATDFLGTTDDQPLIFRLNDEPALRLEYTSAPIEGVNVIAFPLTNGVGVSAVGTTVLGGGQLPFGNFADQPFSTVSGGSDNEATGSGSVVAGGDQNVASGGVATVAGGRRNVAAGFASFAAGDQAEALDDKTFVWSSQALPFASTGPSQFLIDAPGGVGIGTNAPLGQLHVRHAGQPLWGIRIERIGQSTFQGGIRISGDGFLDVTNDAHDSSPNFARLNSFGDWAAVSDRRLKKDVAALGPVLEEVLALRPVTYRFKTQRGDERHIGFIAQDVREPFPSFVNDGDTLTLDYARLSTIAIAALQEQQAVIDAQQDEIDVLRARLERIEALLAQH